MFTLFTLFTWTWLEAPHLHLQSRVHIPVISSFMLMLTLLIFRRMFNPCVHANLVNYTFTSLICKLSVHTLTDSLVLFIKMLFIINKLVPTARPMALKQVRVFEGSNFRSSQNSKKHVYFTLAEYKSINGIQYVINLILNIIRHRSEFDLIWCSICHKYNNYYNRSREWTSWNCIYFL